MNDANLLLSRLNVAEGGRSYGAGTRIFQNLKPVVTSDVVHDDWRDDV